jgi:hypothetical protein
VFNQCIEDIGAINTARVAEQAKGAEAEESNCSDDKQETTSLVESPAVENSADVDNTESPGRVKVPVPTGAREVRLKLAELHRQLLNVDREIVGMRDVGFAHAKKRDSQGSENNENSEYDAYEQSVNRALRLRE